MIRGDKFFAHLQYRGNIALSKLAERLRKTDDRLRHRGFFNRAFRPCLMSVAVQLVIRSRTTPENRLARDYLRQAASMYTEAFRY